MALFLVGRGDIIFHVAVDATGMAIQMSMAVEQITDSVNEAHSNAC